jgi:acetoin:2,6-dichlorophenolindophenol oxidoreductase subunit alpha
MAEKNRPESAAAAQDPHASQSGFSLISNEKLVQLYSAMVKCRMLEERARVLFKRGKFEGKESAAGREAAIVAVALDLGPEDTIAASQNELSLGFIRGAPLEKLLCRIDADSAGKRKDRPHPLDAAFSALNVIASSASGSGRFAVAAGVALANGVAKNGKVAAAFSLEPRTLTDDQRDALRFAGGEKLPIVFVCEIELQHGTPRRAARRRMEDLVATARECGIPGIAVDGNDVVAVYRVAFEAIARARQGRGPTLIECKMGRKRGNSKTDDPIMNMEKYLARKGLFHDELRSRIAAEFNQELDAAAGAVRGAGEAGGRSRSRRPGR